MLRCFSFLFGMSFFVLFGLQMAGLLSALEQLVYVRTFEKIMFLSLKFSNLLLDNRIIAFNSIQISE